MVKKLNFKTLIFLLSLANTLPVISMESTDFLEESRAIPLNSAPIKDQLLDIEPEEFHAAILQLGFTRRETSHCFKETSQEIKDHALETIKFFMEKKLYQYDKKFRENLNKQYVLGYLDTLRHYDQQSLEIFNLGEVNDWKHNFSQKYSSYYLDALENQNLEEVEIFRWGLANGAGLDNSSYEYNRYGGYSIFSLMEDFYPKEIDFIFYNSDLSILQKSLFLRSCCTSAIHGFYKRAFRDHKNELVNFAKIACQNPRTLSKFKEVFEEMQYSIEEELVDELKCILLSPFEFYEHISKNLLDLTIYDLRYRSIDSFSYLIDPLPAETHQNKSLKALGYNMIIDHRFSDKYERRSVTRKIFELGNEYSAEIKQYFLNMLTHSVYYELYPEYKNIIEAAKLLIKYAPSEMNVVTENLFLIAKKPFSDQKGKADLIEILINLENKDLAVLFCSKILSDLGIPENLRIKAVINLLKLDYKFEYIEIFLNIIQEKKYLPDVPQAFEKIIGTLDENQGADFCLQVLNAANAKPLLKIKAAKTLIVKLNKYIPEAAAILVEIFENVTSENKITILEMLMHAGETYKAQVIKLLENAMTWIQSLAMRDLKKTLDPEDILRIVDVLAQFDDAYKEEIIAILQISIYNMIFLEASARSVSRTMRDLEQWMRGSGAEDYFSKDPTPPHLDIKHLKAQKRKTRAILGTLITLPDEVESEDEIIEFAIPEAGMWW